MNTKNNFHYKDALETPRLTTRFLTAGDATAWEGFFNSDIATAYIPIDRSLSVAEQASVWIGRQLARYREGTLGMQVLIGKEAGDFIGMCGLLVQEVDGKREIEVGYHLLPRHWGKGYATEAAMKFRDYGFENNIADSIVSIIHPFNERSQKVAVRNGMTLVANDAVCRGSAYHLFRITRTEWEGGL
jgi:ribosomal-protein-alanine N-acetyltransferase